MYFESHAHYNHSRYNKDRDKLINNLYNNGIDYIVNIGYDIDSSKTSIDLSGQYDFFYATVGVHPHNTENMAIDDINTLKEYAKNKKVVAIGEIGLDYHYMHSTKEMQKKWFIQQLNLAKDINLPVIIHSREASSDMLKMLKEAKLPTRDGKGAGVLHCYSESLEMAKEYVKLGFYLGICGVITYANAKKLIEVVEHIPLEHLLIETDCPYLTPQPNRGKRNDSLNLQYISKKIADIKGISIEQVAKATKDNAMTFFTI